MVWVTGRQCRIGLISRTSFLFFFCAACGDRDFSVFPTLVYDTRINGLFCFLQHLCILYFSCISPRHPLSLLLMAN